MDVKEMRKTLKELDISVPRSNKDVVELYNKEFNTNEVCEETVEPELKAVPSGNQYTYIGSGDTPPQIIKFMGRQVFTRGVLTTVTDPIILAKIGGNKSFVKGKVDGEELYKNDEEARNKVDLIREEDMKIEIHMQRQNKG